MFNGFYAGQPESYGRERVVFPTEKYCAVCGRKVKEGYKFRDVFSSNFGDHYSFMFPLSDAVCEYCEVLFRDDFRRIDGILCSLTQCLIVTPKNSFSMDLSRLSNVKVIAKSDILHCLVNPPEPPFFVALKNNEYKNKHFIYQAVVNFDKNLFFVSMNGSRCLVDRVLLQRMLDILQSAGGVNSENVKIVRDVIKSFIFNTGTEEIKETENKKKAKKNKKEELFNALFNEFKSLSDKLVQNSFLIDILSYCRQD